VDFTILTELTDLMLTIPFIVGYTNTSAFKRVLLKSDIYAEQAAENRLRMEAIEAIQAEAEERQDNALKGQVVGGTLGLIFGGPTGMQVGSSVGSTVGMNYDNTAYTSFIGDKSGYAGKFYMSEGIDAYNLILSEAESMEDQQDLMTDMAALNFAKDLIFADYSKVDEWWDADFKGKWEIFKESGQDHTMSDFIDAVSLLTGGEKEAVVESGEQEGWHPPMAHPGSGFYGAYENISGDWMSEEISNLVNLIDTELPEGFSGSSLEDINEALNLLGYQSLAQDAMDAIINYNQQLFEDETSKL
jgi:hypothetical protein